MKVVTIRICKGRSGRYLNIGCGNTKCRQYRSDNTIKPVVNSISRKLTIDLAIKIVKEEYKIDEKAYEKVREKYLESKALVIVDKTESIKAPKAQR